MKKLLLYSISILFLASCANYHIKKGDTDFHNLRYIGAIHHYKKALNNKSNDLTKLKLARTYQVINNYNSAYETYKSSINSVYATPADILNYAEVLMNRGEYKEAACLFKN